MDAIVVVDMQVGLLDGPPKYDLPGVLDRINQLTAGFEPKTPGWAFLPELDRQETDVVVEKTLNDPFAGTDLKAVLEAIAPDRVLIAGWAGRGSLTGQLPQSLEKTIFGAGSRMPSAASVNGTTREVTTSG